MEKKENINICIVATLLTSMAIIVSIQGEGLIASILAAILIFITYILTLKKFNFDEFIVALLATSAFTHSINGTGINISISDIYLVIGLVVLLLTKKDNIKIPKMYLVLVLIYLTLCSFTFVTTNEINRTLIRMIQYSEYLLFTVLIFTNIDSLKVLKKMLILYIAVSTILSIIGILYTIQNGYNGGLYILGFHKNALGLVVGYAIPIIMGLSMLDKTNKVYLILLILNIITLLLTFSRSSMIAAIVSSIMVYLFIGKGKHIIKIAAVILLLSIILLQIVPDNTLNLFFDFSEKSSAYSRVIIFNDAMEKIKDNLIFGTGIGSYFISLPFINFKQDDPNNVFLLNLLELGIVGLIVFILILIYIYIYAFNNMRLFKNNKSLLVLNSIFISTFTARLVHVQFDVMWVRGNSLFMFSMVGMLFALREIYKKDLLKLG